MSRRPHPSEFGFTTSLYVPPARPRSVWKTLVFSALLALIPVVGPGISTVYVDRRDDPDRFDFMQALVTAAIQLVALAAVVIIAWLLVVLVLGVRIQLSRG